MREGGGEVARWTALRRFHFSLRFWENRQNGLNSLRWGTRGLDADPSDGISGHLRRPDHSLVAGYFFFGPKSE